MRFKKKIIPLVLLSTVIAASAMTRLFADCVFFIGKNASCDGTALIGRAIDSDSKPARTYFELVPRVENKPGRRHWGSDGFVWYYPPTTWRTVSLSRMKSDEVGSEAAFAMNEKGLVVIAVKTDVPQSEDVEGISQLSGGATEREYPAVLTKYCTNALHGVELVKTIVRRCGSGRANIILIADTKEAYIVETHLGNKCESIRLDDDAFISFGDSFTLNGFKMPKAAKKYSLKEAFGILRNRRNSKNSSACHVLAISPSTPRERAVTAWTSLGDPAFGVFLPVSNAMEEFDDAFKMNDSRANPHFSFCADYAVDAFLRLQALGLQDRSLYGKGIVNYWLAREDELISGWQKRFANGNAKSLTDYSRKEQSRALKDAGRLAEEVEYAMLRHKQFEASDFDQIALNQMQKEGIVRYPVILEKGEFDFSDVPRWNPKMDEWKDPTLVQWGKKLALGKKRILVCVAHQDTFAAQHLRNRIDVECDIIESGYFKNTDKRWTSKLPRLERALESDIYDGYVFIGTGPSYWPKRLQRRLAELQIKGRPVALVNAGNWGGSFKEDLEFSRGAPRSFEILKQDPRPDAGEFDLVWTNAALPSISIGSFGNGKIVRLNLPRPEKDTYMVNPRFSPSWTMTPDRVFQDEYCYAYSCRAVMEALGLRDTAKVVQVRKDEIIFSSLSNLAATASLSIRDCWGNCISTKDYPLELKSGETKLPIDVGDLEVGFYGIDVILRTKAGTLDYAMDLFRVDPKDGASAIVEARLDKECFMPSDIITGEVKVRGPCEKLKVVAYVRDPRQRTIVREEWNVDPSSGIAKIKLDQKRLRLNCHFIYFSLVDEKGKLLDKERVWFFRKILDGEKGDFRIFDSAASHGGKDCEPRLAILDWHGMSLLQHGNAQRLFYGTDPAIRERIPGRKNVWDGSLSSPAWKKWLVKTYTKHAKSLSNKNGRLISLGDDSTECWDFYEGRPDWVQPFFNLLEKRLEKMAEPKIKAGNKRGLFITKQEWLSQRGFDPKMVGASYYWGFQLPLEKKVGLEKLLAALKEEDLPLVKEAVKIGYDDVRVFNYANNVSVKDFDSIDMRCVRNMRPVRKPEFPYFIKWLSERYKTAEKISKAWEVKVDDIWAIELTWFDRIVREGNVYAGVDRDRFLEWVFDMNCKLIGETVRAVDPSIIVGYGASCVGHELQEQFDWLSLSAGYATTCILQTNRRLRRPNTYIGECIGWYGWPIGWVCEDKVSKERREKEGWGTLFKGANFCWMWTTSYGLNGAREIHPSAYGWLFETLGEICRGPAALVNRAKRADDGVAVLLSLDSHPLKRLGEGRKDNLMESLWWTHQCVLNQVGFEYITPRDIRSGELQKRSTKLLILPDIDYVDEKAAGEICRFVANGGAVYANRESGLYDIDGRKLAKGAFGDLFSNTNSPNTRIFQSSKGAKTFSDGIKELGITSKIRVVDSNGKNIGGVIRFERERGEYVFAIEKGKAEKEVFPKKAFVELEKPGAVYDVRSGKRIGEGAITRFPIEFRGLDERLFSWQPYSVDRIDIDFAAKPVRGGTLRLKAKLVTTPCGNDKAAKPAKRVFRVEFIPSEGFPKTAYAPIPRYLPDAPNGELSLDIPLAFDERDDLVIEVTDVATGVKAKRKLEFEK